MRSGCGTPRRGAGERALAVNITRRHLTKGQQAMIAARALSIDGVKKLSTRQAGEAVGVSHMRVSQARTVLEFAPDLADGVMSVGRVWPLTSVDVLIHVWGSPYTD